MKKEEIKAVLAIILLLFGIIWVAMGSTGYL